MGKSQVRRQQEGLKRDFLVLLPKAAQLHPLTWCVKHQTAVLTSQLRALRCWKCREWVLNEGVCDPL